MLKNLKQKSYHGKKSALILSVLFVVSILFILNLTSFTNLTTQPKTITSQIPQTRAQTIIQNIQQDDPEAQITSNTETSITFRLKDGKYKYVGSMGKLYTKDNIQIDTSIQPSTHPLFNYQTTQGLDYKLYFRNDSTRRYIPRRDISNEYIEIGVPQYLDNGIWKQLPLGDPNIDGSRLYFEQKDYTLEHLVTPDGAKVNLILNNESFNKPIRWPISFHNLTKEGETLVSDIDNETVANFTPPRWYDSGDKSGSINWSVENGYVTYDASDLTGATYPVTIDPTYGPTGIAAGADDYDHLGNTFRATNAFLEFGMDSDTESEVDSGLRFLGIDMATGSTIDSAIIDFDADFVSGSGTVYTKIAAVDEDNPAAATNDAKCDA